MLASDPTLQAAPAGLHVARARRAWPFVAFVLGVTAYYAFVASAGHFFTHWPTWSTYYDEQAEGFRAGHLHLPVAPDPRLLEADDPLDPSNRQWWRWDYSYYQGRLHIYWGLAPAVLIALGKAALRWDTTVADAALVMLFLVGRAALGWLLLTALARRLTPAPPRWAVGLAILVFATANPVPFMLARPAIYEAAIAGGAFFMTAGLYCSLEWLFAADARGARRWALAASALLGLGGACRPSLLPAAAVTLGALVLATWRRAPATSRLARAGTLGAAALPFGAVASAHLVVNYLRFGSFGEFGTTYQMGYHFQMGPRFVLANLWNYLAHPVHYSCDFPFLVAHFHESPRPHLPPWLPWPADYFSYEPVTGVLLIVPFLWLLPGAWLLGAGRGGAALTGPSGDAARSMRRVLGLCAAVSALPLLLMFASTMRYELDLTSSLIVAAAMGGWALLEQPRGPLWRVTSGGAYAALALTSIAAGVLFGFSGYFEHFARANADLMQVLQRALSACPAG